MVTQTNRFKAAAPGALVANMTSAYSGIRWGTGLPRQFQYERSQSRIGGSLWDYPLRFLDNSPIFRADRVETPLLMLHNDEDDAVPWYQGIEYFLALRRLGKEAYMFNYNGEKHGLRKRINQKDYTRRLQEFFDHYLKGAPAPEWMEKGIPFLQREKEKEKYRVSEEDATLRKFGVRRLDAAFSNTHSRTKAASSRRTPKSVFRDARIDVFRPRRDPAFQVDQSALKTGAFQRLDRFRTTHAALAMNDRLHFRIDLVHAAHHVAQRDQFRSRDARDLEFVRLAHVDDLNLISTQTTRV